MPFLEPITVKEAIDKVHSAGYVLPAIQREFLWKPGQIEKLFDSIMRGYPINTFLFWEIAKDNVNNYQFYEFLREYHQRDKRHNPKANIKGVNGVVAILDGQQRLTSLYIGLRGTYAYKLPRKRWTTSNAFPERKLCLNLLSPSQDGDDLEPEYDLRFLTADEQKRRDEDHYWFVVGDVLEFSENHEVKINEYLIHLDLNKNDDKSQFAQQALIKLYRGIYENKSINFFLERDQSLDKVLNIFIRINSGGIILSKADLIFSTAIVHWKEKDAREEIIKFVQRMGAGEEEAKRNDFNIDKDFVLKTCLVLADFKNIALNVNNFTKENMLTIEDKWENITKAIQAALTLVSSFGYQRGTLIHRNALIPIAYYLYKIDSPGNFSEPTRHHQEDRNKIFKWLVMVFLKGTFSRHPDSALRPMREVISSSEHGFPLNEIILKLKDHRTKSISFSDDEVNNLAYSQYPHTYIALTCIYPSLDFRNRFHQDHIFPQRLFTKSQLENRNLSNDNIGFYLQHCNCLANLQLLEEPANKEKSGKEFATWLEEKYPDEGAQNAYKERHYIPNIDLSFENFPQFIEERKRLITAKFNELLK